MQLAQLNVAHAIADMESPIMADFVNATDRINKLGAESPGYVWGLEERPEEEREDRVKLFGSNRFLANMTVWESREHLFQFVYNTGHKDIMIRKKEWFAKMKAMHMVLWYVPYGHQPTLSEGKERLEYVRTHGESEYAFSFKSNF